MARLPIFMVVGLLLWMLSIAGQPLPTKIYRSSFHSASFLLRDAPVEETLRRYPDYSVASLSQKNDLASRVLSGLQVLGIDADRKNFKESYQRFQVLHGLEATDGRIDIKTIQVMDKAVAKQEFEDRLHLARMKEEFPGLRFLPGSTFTKDDNPVNQPVDHHKAVIYRAMKMVPEEHAKALRSVTLYYAKNGHRGLGGGDRMILKPWMISDDELGSLFFHELGHVVDTGFRKGVIASGDSGFRDGRAVVPADDPSVEFYRISWKNNKETLPHITAADFVSGYGKSDPFEDFSECYAMYIRQAREFRFMAKHNPVLAKKYAYLRDKVFGGREYDSGFEPDQYTQNRFWDVTVRPVQMREVS